MTEDRTNEDWISALADPSDPAALDDLRAALLRGLRYAIKQRYRVTEADIEDFVQDALVRVLNNIHSFRGESRFLTWAQKIAVRVAFSELRRKRWENISLQDLVPDQPDSNGSTRDSALAWMPSTSLSPEQKTTQSDLGRLLDYLIREELTDRQRDAMTAIVLKGMPLEEVARRMGTNRNALYKLLHDARQRLKRRLELQGLTVDDVMGTFARE